MQLLRSPDGCPWDREQTHASIRKNFLEETYEVLEAIDNQDPVLLREELGDFLLHVEFHAQMEAEKGGVDFADVEHDISTKLIVRHPHDGIHLQEGSSDEVLANWEAIKKRQKPKDANGNAAFRAQGASCTDAQRECSSAR
ncbi:MAG: MazG nucleotide pyrophosphohydrolase domain-containing protein [Oscillospiraceae bacterium]